MPLDWRVHAASWTAVGLLSSCTWLQAETFTKATESGVTRGQVDVALVSRGLGNESATGDVDGLLASDSALNSRVDGSCRPISKESTTFAAPGVAIILAAGGKLMFDLFMDARARSVKELKEAAAPAPYGGRVILSGADLHRAECALLVRWATGDAVPPTPLLIALLKINKDPGNTVIWLTPVYVRAVSAVAVTAPGADDVPAFINVAFGVATKAVGRTAAAAPAAASLPTVVTVGEGSITVARVPIGKKARPRCVSEACASTDLIALPPASGYASFSLTAAEVGKVGFDIDVAAAEVAAVKAAIGPAVSDTIKERLK